MPEPSSSTHSITDPPATTADGAPSPTEPPAEPPAAPSWLVTLYAVFALAAGARAGVQLATRAHHAPVAYSLSAVAAVIYLAGGAALRTRTATGRRTAVVLAVVELAGVVTVGTLSLVVPDAFPDASVWSYYGIGYGFVPLILPMLALGWLSRSGRRRRTIR